MDIRLIALDLDGTLLDEEKQIHAKDVEIIQKAMDQGVLVTLVSARPVCSMEPFAKRLGLNLPLVSLSGAYISDRQERQVFLKKPVDLQKYQQMIAPFEEDNYYIKAYSNNRLFVQAATAETLHYTKVFGVPYTEVGMKKLRTLDDPPLRLAVFDEPERIKKVLNTLELWADSFKVVRDGQRGLEIVEHSVSKGAGLTELCRMLKIPLRQVMAVGNEGSDIAMIEAAGLGVAMGNACEELKERAAFVTKANTEGGVGYAIQKYVLRKL